MNLKQLIQQASQIHFEHGIQITKHKDFAQKKNYWGVSVIGNDKFSPVDDFDDLEEAIRAALKTQKEIINKKQKISELKSQLEELNRGMQ